MVGLGGLEPPTSHLSGAHSNQLSYRPPKTRNLRKARSYITGFYLSIVFKNNNRINTKVYL